jgi:hypothetical protein
VPLTNLNSVRVARQMRDAYGLKPKDRPAMYVKCKVPEFERNVAQVRNSEVLCIVVFARVLIVHRVAASGTGHCQAPHERRKL